MTITSHAAFEETRFDIPRTMALQQLGKYDPTARYEGSAFIKVHEDEHGRVVRHTIDWTEARVEIAVAGEGAAAVIEGWRDAFPLDDGIDDFVAEHPVLERLVAAFPALRLVRVPWRFDVAVGAVLQQRVAFVDAARAFRRIALEWGVHDALGVALPGPRRFAAISTAQLQSIGIDAQRARTLHLLAREEVLTGFLRKAVDRVRVRRRLTSIPGIGPWTTDMILGFGFGERNALPLGDVHLPSLVASTLGGQSHGTDAMMIELLRPYEGHRFRVARLLWSAVFGAPHLLRP